MVADAVRSGDVSTVGSIVALAVKLITLDPIPLTTAPNNEVNPLIAKLAEPTPLIEAVSNGVLVLIVSVDVPLPNATNAPVATAKSIVKLAVAFDVTPPKIAPAPLIDKIAELRELISPTDCGINQVEPALL